MKRAKGWTCTGSGTCQAGCPMYGMCHCGCGSPTKVASCSRFTKGEIGGRPRRWLAGHNQRVLGGYACTKRGVPLAYLLPDLKALVRINFGVRGAARASGLSQTGINKMLRGETRRVRLGNAIKITNALRARDTEDEWRAAEKRAREVVYKRTSRALRKAGLPSDGRYRKPPQKPTDHQCTHCGDYKDTSHALYLHSVRVHDDRTQGQHAWVTKRREKVTA